MSFVNKLWRVLVQGWKGAGTKNINILRLWGGNLSGLEKFRRACFCGSKFSNNLQHVKDKERFNS